MRSLLIIVLLSAIGVRASANGPEIGQDAGAIFPIESAVVHLVAESVDVRYDWSEYRSGTAECVYYLGNDSDSTQTFNMAFVSNRPFEYEGAYTRAYRDMEMRVDIEGRDVAVRLAPLVKEKWDEFIKPLPDSLPMWAVTIAAHDTTRVHMRYRVAPSGGAEGHHGHMALQYRCRPAAQAEAQAGPQDNILGRLHL